MLYELEWRLNHNLPSDFCCFFFFVGLFWCAAFGCCRVLLRLQPVAHSIIIPARAHGREHGKRPWYKLPQGAEHSSPVFEWEHWKEHGETLLSIPPPQSLAKISFR